MTNTSQLYSFVFRGLLAEQALDNAGRVGPSVPSELDPDVKAKLSLDLLDEKLLADAKRMAAVYVAVATFESGCRRLVEKVLLDLHGVDWWMNKVSEKIRTKAETRKGEEQKFKWHTPRGLSPLNYTDFGDLANIIRQNWIDFEPHLRSQDWVDSIFDVIERSRNVIMHSGQLADRDIERVGINIRDWIAQVGA